MQIPDTSCSAFAAAMFSLLPCLCPGSMLQLYQLLSDRFPFWDVDLHQIDSLGGAAIREGIVHGPVIFPMVPWSTDIHQSAQDLILQMLQRDPKKRITASQALKHPWFAHVAEAELQQQAAATV